MKLVETMDMTWEEIKASNTHLNKHEDLFKFIDGWTEKMETLLEEGLEIGDIIFHAADEVNELNDFDLDENDLSNALTIISNSWIHMDLVNVWYAEYERVQNMELLALTEEEYDRMTAEEIESKLNVEYINHLCSVLEITPEELHEMSETEIQTLYAEKVKNLETDINEEEYDDKKDGAITINTNNPTMHPINVNKIQDLEDVRMIIAALNINVSEGTKEYELLKHLI